MNNLFKILLLIIITNSKVFAQTDIKNFYTVPPNPESRKLIQSFDSNVNKPNGSVGISYPIFQITQGDLSINLSLGYNSTGIKVNDIASNIGLGWELNGIPKITRTVRGLADEFPNSGYMNTNIKITSFNDLNQLNKLYYIKLAQENLNDFEADLFYVDLGYKSFKMFWNQIENRFITIPYNDDIKIEFGNSNNRGIESWIITDTNGKKFYFGHNKNHTKTSFEYSDVIQSFTISRNSSLNNIKNVTANSSWNILEIYESNNNTNITFEYETISETTEIYELNNTFYKDIKHLISSNGFQECVSTDDGYNMSLINYNKYNLKNIYSKNNLIKFNYSENPRDDLGFKNIVSFELYSGNILLKSILLNQSYTNSNSPDPFNNLYDASKRRKRLILNSISEIVGNNSIETKYKYNNILLPPRFSYAQDFWGYYNGENSNVNFNPQIVFNKRMYGKAIRTVDTIVNKAQILEQIILPTGGIIKYNFETNNIHKSQIITDSDLSYAHNKLFEARIDFAKSNTYKINDYLYSRTFNIPETISGNIQFYSSVTGCNPSNNLTFDCNWTINLKGISSTNSNINIDYQNISTTQLASFLPPGDYKLTANYNEPSALSNNSTNPNFNFYIKYNYLDNDPNLTNLNVGGLRINEIKYLAQDNKVLKIEKYKYNNFSNDPVINNNDIDYIENVNLSDISSGLINGFPQFLKLETFICTFYKTNGYIKDNYEVIEIFSNPLSEYGNINGSSILYRNVSKEILNGNKSIKELYTYSGSINRTLYYKNNIIKYLGDNGELMSTSLNDKYWAYVNPYFSNFNSYEQNLPISKTYFGGDLIDYKVLDNTKLIYQEKSFYDVLVFNKKRIIPFFGFRASLPSSNDANQSNAVLSDEFHYGIYNIALEESRLVSKTKYDFIDNDFISSNENYFYDNKNRISKTITNDNTGSSVSENYYPDPNQHSQLLQLNIIDNPIKTILYKNNELINKTIVEYNPNISFTKPSRVLNYKSEFDENPDYIIFSQYDMYDNILKYTTDNLIFKKIVWGYNNSLPIMEIEDIGNYFEEDNFSSIINASNNYNNLNLLSLLKDFKINFGNSILHKSYTHIPGIGLEHVIDQDNNTIKYEYDDFYRLYKIYNNNKLIESYQYNYKN